MARLATPLTNTKIATAKPKDKPYRLWDGGGLSILISTAGTKRFYVRFKRPYMKKTVDIPIGIYPALSLLKARKIRMQIQEDLAMGIDPIDKRREEEERRKRDELNVFSALVELWKPIKKSKVQEKSFKSIMRIFNNHILPTFGNEKITSITIPLVVEKIKYLDKKGLFSTRDRVVIYMREVMSFATIYGIMKYNPLADLAKAFPVHREKHFATLPPTELFNIFNRMDKTHVQQMTKMLFKFQVLTMVRPGEAVTAEWTDIDLELREWKIPAEKMKGGRKMHIVPLSDQAVRLLKKMQYLTGNRKYVFSNKRYKHLQKCVVNSALLRAGFKGDLTAHGLRSIASTWLNDEGVEGDLIEACLSHKVGNDVRNAYNRSTFFERRKPVMQLWADFVEKSANGLLFND